MDQVATLPKRNLMAANLIVEIEEIARAEDTLHNRIRNALSRVATTAAAVPSEDALINLKKTLRSRMEKVHDNPEDYSPRVIELWGELSGDI